MIRTLNVIPRVRAFQPRTLVRGLAVHAATPTPAAIPSQLAAPKLLENMTVAQRNAAALFTMSKERGFLPREVRRPPLARLGNATDSARRLQDPLAELPSEFAPIESLLQRMTIRQPNGSEGLLAKGEFGAAVLTELNQATTDSVLKAIGTKQQPLISALFRDFCFLTSAYLLEPIDISFRVRFTVVLRATRPSLTRRVQTTGIYGEGRDTLPYHLAVPLKALADELGHFPFM